jgi:hypothetical protein
MTTARTDGPDFTSPSLLRHLTRGVVGFGGLIGSVAFLPLAGPAGLLLLPVGLPALRGCPMCWTIGLIQTLSRDRLRRTCEDGRCGSTGRRRRRDEVGPRGRGGGRCPPWGRGAVG